MALTKSSDPENTPAKHSLSIMATTASAKMMRAVICDAPGPVSVLNLREVTVPTPQPGQMLVKVLAFGINRAGVFP